MTVWQPLVVYFVWFIWIQIRLIHLTNALSLSLSLSNTPKLCRHFLSNEKSAVKRTPRCHNGQLFWSLGKRPSLADLTRGQERVREKFDFVCLRFTFLVRKLETDLQHWMEKTILGALKSVSEVGRIFYIEKLSGFVWQQEQNVSNYVAWTDRYVNYGYIRCTLPW